MDRTHGATTRRSRDLFDPRDRHHQGKYLGDFKEDFQTGFKMDQIPDLSRFFLNMFCKPMEINHDWLVVGPPL